MPEHVHLLISEPQRGAPSTVLQKLKLRVARKLRKRRRSTPAGQMHLPFEERGEPLRAFLAGAFLRFQRVQREEEDREAELHARESDESQVGEASERLAMEQLGILHAGGESPGADRRLRKEGNSQDPGFTNQNLGHPPSSYSCSGPPVRVGKVLVQIDV